MPLLNNEEKSRKTKNFNRTIVTPRTYSFTRPVSLSSDQAAWGWKSFVGARSNTVCILTIASKRRSKRSHRCSWWLGLIVKAGSTVV